MDFDRSMWVVSKRGTARMRAYVDGAVAERNKVGISGSYGVLLKDREGNDVGEASGAYLATTSNRMELTAAIAAFDLWVEAGGARLLVVSDSKYVVKGWDWWLDGWVRNGWRTYEGGAVKNRDLWQELLERKREKPHVGFQWQPGLANCAHDLARFALLLCERAEDAGFLAE